MYDSTEDFYAVQQHCCDRVFSRLPVDGYLDMNINSYIASLTDLLHSPLRQCDDPVSLRREQREIELYVYFRNEYNAKTPREAHNVLAQGLVSESIVALWIDEGMLRDDLCTAAITGYPLFADSLRMQREKRLDVLINSFQRKP